MNVILIGPPGVGKGTHGAWLSERFQMQPVSAGDLLRAEIAQGSDLGKRLKSYLDQGKLAPPGWVVDLFVAHLARYKGTQKHWLFDGCPRAVEQAKLLTERGIALDLVIVFTAPVETLLERMQGRWIHPASGRTYHERFSPPQTPGLDDVTKEPLIKRSDDNRDIFVSRLSVYEQETFPLIEYLQSQPSTRCIEVDASGSIESIQKALTKAMQSLLIASQ